MAEVNGVRLFVALELREDVRQAIGEVIARLKASSRSARWVRPEGMHITLKFIGHVSPEKSAEIRAALEPIGSPHPVELRFRGLGFFPNERRPRVVWGGIEATRNLSTIANRIETALEPLGIVRESRDFVPHLTLARFPAPEKAPELVRLANELQSCEFGSARETEFHLFESVLHRSGAEYKKLQTFRFVREAL
jgi:RNA 2',3'-cyclic 3'-phosphodiesterase